MTKINEEKIQKIASEFLDKVDLALDVKLPDKERVEILDKLAQDIAHMRMFLVQGDATKPKTKKKKKQKKGFLVGADRSAQEDNGAVLLQTKDKVIASGVMSPVDADNKQENIS